MPHTLLHPHLYAYKYIHELILLRCLSIPYIHSIVPFVGDHVISFWNVPYSLLNYMSVIFSPDTAFIISNFTNLKIRVPNRITRRLNLFYWPLSVLMSKIGQPFPGARTCTSTMLFRIPWTSVPLLCIPLPSKRIPATGKLIYQHIRSFIYK